MNDPIVCKDCGISYLELGLDMVLPDQQWNHIFPEKTGILCPNCICKRASKFGGTAVLAWIDQIDYSIQKVECNFVVGEYCTECSHRKGCRSWSSAVKLPPVTLYLMKDKIG